MLPPHSASPLNVCVIILWVSNLLYFTMDKDLSIWLYRPFKLHIYTFAWNTSSKESFKCPNTSVSCKVSDSQPTPCLPYLSLKSLLSLLAPAVFTTSCPYRLSFKDIFIIFVVFVKMLLHLLRHSYAKPECCSSAAYRNNPSSTSRVRHRILPSSLRRLCQCYNRIAKVYPLSLHL